MKYSAIFTFCTAIVQNRIILREFQRPIVESPWRPGATDANRAVTRIGLVALSLCVFCSLLAEVSAVEESQPLLFANYYTWYHDGSHTARPWSGWTRKESEHNVRSLAEQRSGEPPRSSAAYPLAGLYDSADPEVAEWHVQLAQAAGIDAFLVDWWGTHVGRDKNIDKGILVAAEKHGFKFALLDERSQFHSDWQWYKQAAVQALARYKDSASYLRIDGRPVYYLYQVAANATLTPEKFVELKQHAEAKVGLNLSFASGQDDARLRNVRVAGNTFVCPSNVGLVAQRPYRDEDGVPDTRDIKIIDNVFHVGSAPAIRISGIQTLMSRGNTFKQNGISVEDASRFAVISECIDTMVEH